MGVKRSSTVVQGQLVQQTVTEREEYKLGGGEEGIKLTIVLLNALKKFEIAN